MEDHYEQIKKCKKMDKNIKARSDRKQELYKLHKEFQEECDYEKNKLLPVRDTSTVYPSDHGYGKVRKSKTLCGKLC